MFFTPLLTSITLRLSIDVAVVVLLRWVTTSIFLVKRGVVAETGTNTFPVTVIIFSLAVLPATTLSML